MNQISTENTLRRKSRNRLNNEPSDGEIVFSSGIGVNHEPEVPVRFLSYLLPIISAVQAQRRSIGQVYIADKGAVRIGQNPETVEQNTRLTENLTRAFIEEFFPELDEKIVTAREKDETKEAEEVVNSRRQLISRMIDIILKHKKPAIMRFAERRQNGGDIRTPLKYMVEHGLYMRDPVTDDQRLFLVENPPGFENSKIAMIGGPSEEIFYEVRRKIMREMGVLGQQPNLQLFSDIGGLPPYYSKKSDIVIGQSIEKYDVKNFLDGLNRQLQYDYLILIISCTENPDFDIMTKEESEYTDKDYQTLQSGFDRLKSFLKQF
ncbi:MAG: hypothetical protein GF353_07445 [Candidatus Lokiarchaeota archaeon]|nr:hypothetical protein [Candidatus Lokiarchaeota archaeon]